jgi:hypothetical protein
LQRGFTSSAFMSQYTTRTATSATAIAIKLRRI